ISDIIRWLKLDHQIFLSRRDEPREFVPIGARQITVHNENPGEILIRLRQYAWQTTDLKHPKAMLEVRWLQEVERHVRPEPTTDRLVRCGNTARRPPRPIGGARVGVTKPCDDKVFQHRVANAIRLSR